MKRKYILMGVAILSSVVAGAQDITDSIARKTQAVSTISADEISKNATPNVSNTLYGLLPGLSVMQQTGWTDDAATLLRGYNNPLPLRLPLRVPLVLSLSFPVRKLQP